MKVIEGLRERFRNELVSKAEEKISILFQRYQLTKCGYLIFEQNVSCKSIQGTIESIIKENDKFLVTIDYNEYGSAYTSLDALDTTTLEYMVFNPIVGYRTSIDEELILFPTEAII